MQSLEINASAETPEVMFDKSSGVLRISGRSLPEDAFSFYQPIIDWTEAYLRANPIQQIELNFQLDYFNSSSGRYLLELLSKLEAHGKASLIKINWFAEEDDELMIEKGNELKSLIKLPFEVITTIQ